VPERLDDASEPEDDDALSWAGDDRSPARPVVPPRERPEPDEAAREADEEPDADEAEGRRLGAAALLALGVLGGVYLLETVGWVTSAVWSQSYYAGVAAQSGILGSVLTWAIVAAAVAAPALWAFLSWRFNRDSVGRMIAWLAVGAILLLPLPAILPVAGQA